jgi:superoxide reductase
MEIKIYKCSVCGNMSLLLKNGGGKMVCCNKDMDLLHANNSDGASEKHVPILVENIKNCELANASIYKVQVGSVEHPMTTEHYIN